MTASGYDILGLDLDFGTAPSPTLQDPFTYDPFNEAQELLPVKREPIYPWPPKLPFEIALGAETEESILLRYNVSQDDYLRWALTPAFRRALAESAKIVREQGLTFKMLCQGIAQDFLQVLDENLHSEHVAFSTKLAAFQTVTKLAGLEPQAQKDEGKGLANAVQININL